MMRFLLLLVALILSLACIQDSVISNDGKVVTEDSPFDRNGIQELLRKGRGEEVLRLMELLPHTEYKYIDMINRARALAQVTRTTESIQALQDLITQPSQNITENNMVKLILAKIKMNQQQLPEAQQLFRQVLASDPENYEGWLYAGKLLLLEKQPETGLQYMYKAKALNPHDERVLFELGMALLQQKQFHEGRALIQAAAKLNPSIDRKLLGKIYLYYGLLDWGVKELSSAVDLQSDLECCLLLADCLSALGHFDIPHPLYSNHSARLLYEHALLGNNTVSPVFAAGWAGYGLGLLGLSSANRGAITACGLNQQAAIAALEKAQSMKKGIPGVAEALAFCRLEVGEARTWREVAKATTAKEASHAQTQPHMTVQNKMQPMLAVWKRMKRYWIEDLMKVLPSRLRPLVASLVSLLSAFDRFSGSNNSNEEKMRKMIGNWQRRAKACQAVAAISWPVDLLPPTSTLALPEQQQQAALLLLVTRYMMNNQPVMINGLQSLWPLHSLDGGDSADLLSTLKEKLGGYMVRASLSPTGRFDGGEASSLWGLTADRMDKGVLVRPPQTSLLFADLLTLMSDSTKHRYSEKKDMQRGTITSIAKAVFYLEYLALHQYFGSAFADLVPLPFDPLSYDTNTLRDTEQEQQQQPLLKPVVNNLWLGTKPTISPLHYDDEENILCVAAGVKEVLLWPPHALPLLYYEGRPKGTMMYTHPNTFTRLPLDTNEQKKRIVFGSAVNVDQPDYHKHPKFKQAGPPLRALLTKGKCLYLPAFWHHEVQSLPFDYADDMPEYQLDLALSKVEQQSLNLAVNFWFANLTAPVNDAELLGLKS